MVKIETIVVCFAPTDATIAMSNNQVILLIGAVGGDFESVHKTIYR
ncbi:hypothetical protein [Flexilinea flocculi]|uniref:Uncharacterized protein n=1 Tax=Flexilinea flocculi TaxID=1678840 RepID=A0A0K8PBL9_9CHLR|nr:hypothetical protein [Flexilinea flocculi]GAP40036.1 hypothetical protein ATC1_12576 [Flexilinea flocculi]